MDDRLIVALDVPDTIQGLQLVKALGPTVHFYKIGLGLLTTGGLGLAQELKHDHGKKIFLDLKLFDISTTIETAVHRLATFNLDFLTVHGDPHVVKAAKQGASGTHLKILAVTFLTSLDRPDLDDGLIQEGAVSHLALERAIRAFESGADGVIASPHDIRLIRNHPKSTHKLIVTPGIRPAGHDQNDQKRIATPRKAIKSGADHIVVGRPIWQSSNPSAQARNILREFSDL
ncbi:MAG: orotidine-5'-phosphate decarboxylase [Aestuariivita sp.]|nr:orotidine-5'-phosphate decarboxylase [Aestuariivita sp.]